jgi:dipeptidyl aminopeptidase/acylaminoacyl peptidase
MNRILIAVCLMALTLPSLSANDQRARVLLQAAEAKAKLEGDLNGAIKIYRDAEKEAGANRALVAQALVKMAEAYQQLGDAAAQKIYRRVVSDFSDQKESAVIAQARLVPSPRTAAGATLRDVSDLNKSGNVSADGRFATYVNWETGNIGVRDLVSGTSRDVTARPDYVTYEPRLSRDGKFVAYVSYNGCVGRKFEAVRAVLCVIGVEGEPNTVARTIVDRAEISDITPADWAPDGRSIAVNLHRQDGTVQIGIVGVADGSVTVLQSTDWRGATRIFFSPDGRYVAFDVPVDDSSDHQDIRVVAVDGSNGSTVVHDPSQNVVMGWTADGRHLLFASDRSGAMSLWAQRVTNVRADGNARLVHPGLGGGLSLGLTRAGSLYFGVQSGDTDVEILTVDFTSGKSVSSPERPIAR